MRKEFGVNGKLGVGTILPCVYLPAGYWMGCSAGTGTIVVRGSIMKLLGHEKPAAIHLEANQFTDLSRPSELSRSGCRNTAGVPVQQAKLLQDLRHSCNLRSLGFPLLRF